MKTAIVGGGDGSNSRMLQCVVEGRRCWKLLGGKIQTVNGLAVNSIIWENHDVVGCETKDCDAFRLQLLDNVIGGADRKYNKHVDGWRHFEFVVCSQIISLNHGC